jgi:type I restriction enzyme S subunit
MRGAAVRARPYPKYKASGVEWLGDVPEHWEVKRGRFAMDVNPRSSRLRALCPEDEVSFVPMEAIREYGGLDLEQKRVIADIGSGYTEFDDGDVVVAKITPCFENGKGALAAGLTNGAAFGTTELHVLRSGSNIERRFLFYFTISRLFRSSGEGDMYGAGGQKRVPPEFCENVRVPLPPMGDQRAIADYLDRATAKIDALVAKKRTLIERLKEKRTALISRTVTRGLPPEAARAAGLDPHPRLKPSGFDWLGDVPRHWTATKLRHYISILNGFAFPSAGFSDDESDVRLLRGVNVGVSRIRWDDTAYWPRFAGDGFERFELEKGTLVIGMDRPWIAEGVRVAVLSSTDIPCLLLQRVAAIRTNKHLARDFLLPILSSPLFVNYFTPETTGVSVPHISPDQIGDFPVPVPPFSEQLAIADFLYRETSAIDGMVGKVETAIERLQEYRSAMITAAVTGKIDVRGSAA